MKINSGDFRSQIKKQLLDSDKKTTPSVLMNPTPPKKLPLLANPTPQHCYLQHTVSFALKACAVD